MLYRSFHVDHAASLPYIMEKVSIGLELVTYTTRARGRKRIATMIDMSTVLHYICCNMQYNFFLTPPPSFIMCTGLLSALIDQLQRRYRKSVHDPSYQGDLLLPHERLRKNQASLPYRRLEALLALPPLILAID